MLKGLASYCKAETTFTFHFSILTLSNAFLGIDNGEMESESGFSFAIASQPLNIKDPDQGSNLRRKSVASSTPTRSQTLVDQKTTRPILRKCSSLRETRQARRRGVEESKIVR